MASKTQVKTSKAKERWKLLLQILTQKRLNVSENSASKRRFTSFGLLQTKPIQRENSDSESIEKGPIWYLYESCVNGTPYLATLRHLEDTVNIQNLLGFNNTGNVCVWPAEEVLTYFCLKNLNIFSGKKVCELGGGMTCLAGFFVSLHADAKEVLLTDGNDQSIENVKVIEKENVEKFGQTFVHSMVLKWNECDKIPNLKGHFDTVICADCLFFDEYRQDLVDMLDFLLCSQGEVIIFAPKRGPTFQAFQDLSSSKFAVKYSENYDSHVWDLHIKVSNTPDSMYDEDLHYPHMLHLKKW